MQLDRWLFVRTRLLASVAVALVFGLAIKSVAAPITAPTGLIAGDQYRLAFLTSATRTATSSNIADYNAFVTGVANAVPELTALSTTWKAIASTSGVFARDNTGTNPSVNGTGVPIYLLNDTKLADTNLDLWDGTIDLPLNVSETGTVLLGLGSVWTGTSTAGTNCGAYTLGSVNACVGRRISTNSQWIYNGLNGSSGAYSMYALSASLTYVPEPGTALLLSLGLLSLSVHRRCK